MTGIAIAYGRRQGHAPPRRGRGAPGAEENWTISVQHSEEDVQHSEEDVQHFVDNFAEMARDLRAS